MARGHGGFRTSHTGDAMAAQILAWCLDLPDLRGSHPAIAWLKVFKRVDGDESGIVTYDEIRQMVRKALKVEKKEFSEEQIKVLWTESASWKPRKTEVARSTSATSVPRPGPASTKFTRGARPLCSQHATSHTPSSSPR